MSLIRVIQGLMEIAEKAMPNSSFLRTDSRVEAARRWMEDYEWSGSRQGQGFGPHGSGNDGFEYDACPECGGLREPNGEFVDSAVGHRSGCPVADVLERATVVAEGETGSLSL